MKKDIKLKGQLKLYMQWPGIMILFLILMNIWIFRMDRKAGLLMSAFVLVYAVVIGIMYFYNKSLILADMVEFAAQYGIVQNRLLMNFRFRMRFYWMMEKSSGRTHSSGKSLGRLSGRIPI